MRRERHEPKPQIERHKPKPPPAAKRTAAQYYNFLKDEKGTEGCRSRKRHERTVYMQAEAAKAQEEPSYLEVVQLQQSVQ